MKPLAQFFARTPAGSTVTYHAARTLLPTVTTALIAEFASTLLTPLLFINLSFRSAELSPLGLTVATLSEAFPSY